MYITSTEHPGHVKQAAPSGMMGDGVADLRAICGTVEEAGYDGPCEVEVFSAQNWWRRYPGEVLDVVVNRFQTVC